MDGRRDSGGPWPDPDEEQGGKGEGSPGAGAPDPAGGGAPGGDPPRGLASRGNAPRRFSRWVGVAFLIVIGIAVINGIRTDEGGILGAGGSERGWPLAEFALPEVLGPLSGDANIAQDDCESSSNPCPEDERRVPACEIDPAGAIRVCDFFDKPLAISFWFTRGGDCMPTQESFDRVARRHSEVVNFLSVNVRDDREDVREIVREAGWSMPVGHDADGAVSNVYGVGVCPTILLAYPGGILDRAAVKPGNFSVAEIDDQVRTLIRDSRRRVGSLD